MKIKLLLSVLFVAMVLVGCKNVPDESLQPTTDMMEMESSMLDDIIESDDTTQSATQATTTQSTTTLQVETNIPTQPEPQNVTQNSQPQSQKGKISASRAEEIALSHAGVSKSDAKSLKSKLDMDDGRYEYKVDFSANGFEYDYEIDAETGRVLEPDKDRD